MKNRIVLWGQNADDDRLLMSIQLLPEANQIEIKTWKEPKANEDLYKLLFESWRNDKEAELPEPDAEIQRPLSVSNTLLPDELRVEDGDLIQRAQTEWHFTVLSVKLHQAYQAEIDELEQAVSKLDDYDKDVWDRLKEFWGKVEGQIREKNLLREQATSLRERSNELFNTLKGLRKRLDSEFKSISADNRERLMNSLGAVEENISKNLRLQSLFDELKKIQSQYHEAKMTREDRDKVWARLDKAFKSVKEKRFGSEDKGSPTNRLDKRLQGLAGALESMERSIKRDEEELEFQNKRIGSAGGQLEAQLRQAKTVMIEERLRSKKEKYDDMVKTQEDLVKRLESLQVKEEQRQRLEEAKAAAKEKIDAQMKEQEIVLSDEEAEKLKKAAEELKASKQKKAKKEATSKTEKPADVESLAEAVGSLMSESLQDVVDTIRAVADVVGDKIAEEVKEFIQEEEPKAADEPGDEPTAEHTEETADEENKEA
jgi:hypothetical protein